MHWIFFAALVAVQDEPTHRTFQAQVPEEAQKQMPGSEYLTGSFVFGGALALMIVSALIVECVFIWKTKKGLDDINSMRLVLTTLVLGVGGFLIIAGYSANQMAPMYGILGAIVGYLFGSKDSPTKSEPPKA